VWLRKLRSQSASLVIAGQLAPAKVAVVRSWCDRHRESLYADWQRAQRGLHPAGRYDQVAMEPAVAPEMVAVIVRPAHTVRIVFADGEVRDVDVTPLLDTPAFSPLRDPAVFEQVKVDEQTGTIVWPGDVDLDPDVIYAALDLGPDAARVYVLTPSVAA
jgi:Protein of unknown function (DUF2442)